MNQEHILNYNKRCGEFLGWEIAGPGFPAGFWYENKNKFIYFEELKFHSDWNLIHDVVECIKNLTNPKEHSDTTFSTLRREIQTHLGRSHKEATVEAINNFLIWYENATRNS